jgi:hypothetical protein
VHREDDGEAAHANPSHPRPSKRAGKPKEQGRCRAPKLKPVEGWWRDAKDDGSTVKKATERLRRRL